jgi:hypothetical protein
MLEVEKVSYIDANFWKIIKHSEMYTHLVDFLHTTWNSSNKNYFPGPQPISIERRHFGILKKNDYVVCEKTDGIRHALLATMYNEKKMCVLVDRSQEMYLLPLNLPKPMFTGTVMDGELVKTETGWQFLVYDCLLISNKHVGHLNLNTRIEESKGPIDGIMKMAKDPLKIKVKKFWPLNQMSEFLKQSFPYETDGIILTPVNEPVRTGTHETLFKWKPRDTNTIDFKMIWRRDRWWMYVQEKGQLIFESELLTSQCGEFEIKENMIVECQYVHWEAPRWWKPVNIRTDKTHPNNRRTFYRTLVNIAENIQLTEFCNL